MPTGTVRLHRVLRAKPEKIYPAVVTPEAIPAEMCYPGWQQSLEQPAKLVEPEITE